MSVVSVVDDYPFPEHVGTGVLCFSEVENFLYEQVYPAGVLEMVARGAGLRFADYFGPDSRMRNGERRRSDPDLK